MGTPLADHPDGSVSVTSETIIIRGRGSAGFICTGRDGLAPTLTRVTEFAASVGVRVIAVAVSFETATRADAPPPSSVATRVIPADVKAIERLT